jgi:hypothetical protein
MTELDKKGQGAGDLGGSEVDGAAEKYTADQIKDYTDDYEKNHPDAIKDPELARVVADAGKAFEDKVVEYANKALESARAGNFTGAENALGVMENARRDANLVIAKVLEVAQKIEEIRKITNE